MQIDKMHIDFVQNSLILITHNYALFVLSTAQHIFIYLTHYFISEIIIRSMQFIRRRYP